MILPFYNETPTTRLPIITVALIVVNTLSLLYCTSLGTFESRLFRIRHGFIPARWTQMKHGKPITLNVLNDQEIASGMRPPPGVPNRIVIPPDSRGVMLTLVTALFLHAGWVHLLTNMWFLWLFGNSVEDRLGHLPFLALYLAGGVAATACHVLMLPPNMAHVAPLVGASGAVAVILGANAVTYPFARIEALLFLVIIFFVVEIPAILVLGFWFLMQMAYAANGNAAMDGIAWWAHIGGFALGAMVMPLLTRWIPAQPAVPQVGSAVASPDLDDLSAER